MPFCPKCGFEVAGDDNFCRACGTSLQQSPAKTPEKTGDREYEGYGPTTFAKHVLTDGEVPLFETRPLLWIRVMGPIALFVITFGALITAYVYFSATWVLYGIGVLFLVGTPWILWIWLQWRYTIYAATNRRIVSQTGVLGKSHVDCPLSRVQTVYVEVSIFGRMNNFGTLRVATAGEAGVEIEWRDVKAPMKSQRILNEIIQKYGRGGG